MPLIKDSTDFGGIFIVEQNIGEGEFYMCD